MELFFDPVFENSSLDLLHEAPDLAREGNQHLFAFFRGRPRWIAVASAARGLAAKMVRTFTDEVTDPKEFWNLQVEMLEALSHGQA